MGNMFARRPGRNADAPPVITGSHLDTQPTGGKFDGVYGVLAGLEVLRTLDEAGVETDAPLEVVVWTNEEGARFAPAMVGSGVVAGEMQRDGFMPSRTRRASVSGRNWNALVTVATSLPSQGQYGPPLRPILSRALF